MSKKIILILVLIPALLILGQVRDSDIKKNFLQAINNISKSIESSTSEEDFSKIDSKITALKENFSSHKKFLDKALYPKTFDNELVLLNSKLMKKIEKEKLATNLGLSKLENDSLKGEIINITENFKQLTTENNDLLSKIKSLKITIKRDSKTIKQLTDLVDKLKLNIKNRDDLVVMMLDSLFSDFQKPNLTELDKKKMLNTNVFATIKNVVNDNIRFLENSELTPDDYIFIKSEQNRFSNTWKKVAPMVIKTYMEENQRIKILTEIDEKIHDWKAATSSSIFRKLYLTIQKHNLGINEFGNGTEFYENFSAYIDAQISQPDNEIYENFIQKIWNKEFEDKWIQLLLVDDLEEKHYQDLKNKIKKWQEIAGIDYTIYYAVGGGILLLLIIIIVLLASKGKGKETFHEVDLTNVQEQKQQTLNPNYKQKQD